MRRGLAFLGIGLLGYGLLILLGVIAHEATAAGWASLALGAGLLAFAAFSSRDARADTAPGPATDQQPSHARRHGVAALGVVAIAGVLVNEAVRHNGLERAEWGILVYGAALLVAAAHLDRPLWRWRVGDAVAWSFPLLLAPLAMYAINALLSDEGKTAASPIVHVLLVVPTASVLGFFGTPVTVDGNQLLLATPRGGLVLGIGFVCAGLYPMVLFAGMVALHGWREGTGWRRLAAYLAIGLVGLWTVNLVRLAALAKVGQAAGAQALQTAHANLGWILFGVFMLVFWGVVLRYVERPRTTPD